ncbi:hypothetical protein AKJ16_DCAP04146 [Drosera capensis]
MSAAAAITRHHPLLLIPSPFPRTARACAPPATRSIRPTTSLRVSSPTNRSPAASTSPAPARETIFFDGGAHSGDLIANLVFGFTLLWLPLTIAAVSRAFFLRYRFTNLRVSVISGLTGNDRSDFGYDVIEDVKVVPRLVGEWGDIVISLKDGTKVDLRSVPKFREIAQYCMKMKEEKRVEREVVKAKRPRGVKGGEGVWTL